MWKKEYGIGIKTGMHWLLRKTNSVKEVLYWRKIETVSGNSQIADAQKKQLCLERKPFPKENPIAYSGGDLRIPGNVEYPSIGEEGAVEMPGISLDSQRPCQNTA